MISTKLYVEGEDLALAPTIRSVREAELGVVSDAGTDPRHDVYYFWVEAPDFEAVEAALEADHTVADTAVIVETGDRRTYRVEYSDEATYLTPTVTDIGGLTLEARSRLNGWLLSLQLPGHDALYRLREVAREHGMRFDVLELQQRPESDYGDDFGLTESQREALVGAFAKGYYDEPRESSLEELASMLNITPSAVSGRLRRGSAQLIETILVEDEDDAE